MQSSWTTSALTLHLPIGTGRLRRRALEAALRAAIREGRIRAGTRLPSTRLLATDLGVARGTVVEAYAQLVAEGFLSSRRGAGTWVADVATDQHSTRVASTLVPPVRFSFNPGVPDLTAFPSSAWVSSLRRGLRNAPAMSLGYGDRRGRPELRHALADYLARTRGVVADPERIVVTAGFVHGLSILSRFLQATGVRRLAMENPGIRQHRWAVSRAGLDVVPLPVDGQGARTDLLSETEAEAVVLTPAHQFPRGVVLHPDRRTAAVTWARQAEGLVIEDDYDAELRYDRPPLGALQALDPERVAYAGTTSKTLAPGLRLGWLVLPPRFVGPVVERRYVQELHISAPDQIAFAQFLLSGGFERHVRQMRTRYRARRDRLIEVLQARAPSVRPVGMSAGLRVLLELPPGSPSSEELADRASLESIELFPMRWCYHGADRGPDGLVVGYTALPEHSFEAGLAALAHFLERSIPLGCAERSVARPVAH